MKFSARLAATTAALTLAATVAVATPAQALPTGCGTGGGNTYASVYCSGGTGAYQAWAVCFNPTIPGATFKTVVTGPWKAARSGQNSMVSCPFLYVVESRSYSIRN